MPPPKSSEYCQNIWISIGRERMIIRGYLLHREYICTMLPTLCLLLTYREVLQISNNYPNTFCVIIPNTFCVIIMIIDGTLYPIQDKSISMSVAFYRLYLPRARLIVECTQCPARSHTSMKKLVLIHTRMYKIKVHKLLEIWIIPSMWRQKMYI